MPVDVLYRTQRYSLQYNATLARCSISPLHADDTWFQAAVKTAIFTEAKLPQSWQLSFSGDRPHLTLAAACHPWDPSTFPLADKIRVAMDLILLIHQAHSHAIMINGIQPKAIFLCKNQPTIVDFMNSHFERLAELNADWSEDFAHYMAPEQTGRTKNTIDRRTDIFNLGMTLFYIFTGKPPYEGETIASLPRLQLSSQPDVDQIFASCNLPSELAVIVKKMIEKSPQERYQSMLGVWSDLDLLGNHASSQSSEFEPCRYDVKAYFDESPSFCSPYFADGPVLTSIEQLLSQGKPSLFLTTAGEQGTLRLFHAFLTAKVNDCFTIVLRRHLSASDFDFFNFLVEQMIVGLIDFQSQSEQWQTYIAQFDQRDARLLSSFSPGFSKLFNLEASGKNIAFAEIKYLLSNFFKNLAACSQGLVILVEDVDALDSASVKLLDDIFSSIERGSICLIVGCLSESRFAKQIDLKNSFTSITTLQYRIPLLGKVEAKPLLQYVFSSRLGSLESLVDYIYTKTNGEWSEIIDIIRHIVRSPALLLDVPTSTYSINLSKLGEIPLSSSNIARLIEGLDRLAPEYKDVVQALCLLHGSHSIGDVQVIISECSKITLGDIAETIIGLAKTPYVSILTKENESRCSVPNSLKEYVQSSKHGSEIHKCLIRSLLKLLQARPTRELRSEVFHQISELSIVLNEMEWQTIHREAMNHYNDLAYFGLFLDAYRHLRPIFLQQDPRPDHDLTLCYLNLLYKNNQYDEGLQLLKTIDMRHLDDTLIARYQQVHAYLYSNQPEQAIKILGGALKKYGLDFETKAGLLQRLAKWAQLFGIQRRLLLGRASSPTSKMLSYVNSLLQGMAFPAISLGRGALIYRTFQEAILYAGGGPQAAIALGIHADNGLFAFLTRRTASSVDSLAQQLSALKSSAPSLYCQSMRAFCQFYGSLYYSAETVELWLEDICETSRRTGDHFLRSYSLFMRTLLKPQIGVERHLQFIQEVKSTLIRTGACAIGRDVEMIELFYSSLLHSGKESLFEDFHRNTQTFELLTPNGRYIYKRLQTIFQFLASGVVSIDEDDSRGLRQWFSTMRVVEEHRFVEILGLWHGIKGSPVGRLMALFRLLPRLINYALLKEHSQFYNSCFLLCKVVLTLVLGLKLRSLKIIDQLISDSSAMSLRMRLVVQRCCLEVSRTLLSTSFEAALFRAYVSELRRCQADNLAHIVESGLDGNPLAKYSPTRSIDIQTVFNAIEGLSSCSTRQEAIELAFKTILELSGPEYMSVFLPGHGSSYYIAAEFACGQMNYYESGALLPDRSFYSPIIVNYAFQMKATLSLDNACEEHAFKKCKIVSSYDALSVHCQPVILNGRVAGVVYLSNSLGAGFFASDITSYVSLIARQSIIAIENALLYESLEQKVSERTRDLGERNKKIQMMMAKVPQGICTFGEGARIDDQYSSYLETILDLPRSRIENRLIGDVLFSSSNLTPLDLDQIESVIVSSFDQNVFHYELNVHLLPVEMIYKNTKTLTIIWVPICEDDILRKVMLVINDVTEVRMLQSKAKEKANEMQIIERIAIDGIDEFQDVLRGIEDLLDQYNTITKRGVKGHHVPELFRLMHTIKGNAMIHGLSRLADEVHKTEQYLDEVRRDPESLSEDKIMDGAAQVGASLASIREFVVGKLGGDKQQESYLDVIMTNYGCPKIDQMSDKQKAMLFDCVYHYHNFASLESILSKQVKSLANMAERINKASPRVIFEDHSVHFSLAHKKLLQDVFVHCLRNAIDHGIETPAERKGLGKMEAGTIWVIVMPESSGFNITVKDDGRGLNLAALKRKHHESGGVGELSDEELGELIFREGVSTADAVSDISGRGVGMDAVRSFLRNQHWDVFVTFVGERQSNGFRSFQLVIKAPGGCAAILQGESLKNEIAAH